MSPTTTIATKTTIRTVPTTSKTHHAADKEPTKTPIKEHSDTSSKTKSHTYAHTTTSSSQNHGNNTSSSNKGVKTWSFNAWTSKSKSKHSSSGNDDLAPAWLSLWGDSTWSWPNNRHKSNSQVVPDPARSSKKSSKVLKIKYPAGSVNPGNPKVQGGIGFYAHPITLNKEPSVLDLTYSVYFPKGFNFVLGGKLPGVYGGHEKCSGGTKSPNCYSMRFMWRKGGQGEVYAYIPKKFQPSDLCSKTGNVCTGDGISMGRGSFHFKVGAWTTIRQVVKLNTSGKKDGSVTIYANGKQVHQQEQLVYRVSETPELFGIMFDTFFGGSSPMYKTPKTQYSYFKDFVMSAQ
ncbi:hypothetical protein BC940DRAFT_322676 [Gongronella butleri]|nr:hypothetical protein BC940DRAFT_322676 [Gongronella butleri]